MANILIIAPHPDDEVLGCGGTMKKKSLQGNNIYLCITTKAYTPEWSKNYIDNKREEIKKAQKILGIKEIFFLEFPTVKLDSILQKEINDSIEKIIHKIKPTEVYIPHLGDLNKDHRIVHESSLVALRPKPGLSVKKILSYETLSETEWGVLPFSPQVYEDISMTLKSKLKAMEAYKSELKNSPHPRSIEIIKALAIKRGSESGANFAEAFMLIRSIEK